MSTNLPDLAGALRKRPVAPTIKPEPAPAQTARAPRTTQVNEPKPSTERRHVAAKREQPAAAGKRGSEIAWRRSVGFSMPRNVRADAMRQAQSKGTTLTAWLLGALNRHHQQLEQRLSSGVPTSDGGDLFAVPQQRTPEPKVQSTMRVTDEQFDAMERLAGQLNTTRSGLLTAAAEAELEDPA